MHFPAAYEYPNAPYFAEYLQFDADANLLEVLDQQTQQILAIYEPLTEQQANYSYAEGKWSFKQLLGHMVDSERIFAYRALAISRGETQSLPGFDENQYMDQAGYENQSAEEVLTQYITTRAATIALVKSFTLTQGNAIGSANGQKISARALAWMIAGHEKHHYNIIQARYLPHFS
jgi:uncharacterized damage-inducible protein DinB